jgi:hypothetical protein
MAQLGGVQKLAGFMILPAIFAGLQMGGWRGALTGVVGLTAIASAVAILRGESGTGMETSTPAMARNQRNTAVAAGLLVLLAIFYGGWHSGWLYGIIAYVVAAAAGAILFARRGVPASESSAEAQELAAAFADAERLTDAYLDLFTPDTPALLPLSALPAPVPEMKTALLRSALHRQSQGQLTPDILASFRDFYGNLCRFVDSARAARSAAISRGFETVDSEGKPSADAVRALGRSFADADKANALGFDTEARFAMMRDFDERWSLIQSAR